MAIFNSYVKLPEGIHVSPRVRLDMYDSSVETKKGCVCLGGVSCTIFFHL